MNDKIGRFYLPTKSLNKNLSCVMQKSPDFVRRHYCPILSAKIECSCSIFDDFVGRLFVYRETNFVYVAMVIVYNGK